MAKTAATRKQVTRRGWTASDERELRKHSKARTPVAKISRAMKRTPGALRQKARHLGSRLVTVHGPAREVGAVDSNSASPSFRLSQLASNRR